MSNAERQAALAANFSDRVPSYVASQPNLFDDRPHQPATLAEIRDDMLNGVDQDRGPHILIPHACGSGKTALAAMLAGMAGVGQAPAAGERPLVGITLTPYSHSVDATPDYYEDFAPNTTPALRPHATDLGAIATNAMSVATYNAILRMDRAKLQELAPYIDFGVLDEPHRALGPRFAPVVEELMELSGMTTLMLDATPEFREGHSVESVLSVDYTAERITPRDGIDLGITNGVRLMALKSEEAVDLDSTGNTITPRDIRSLRLSKSRNNLIATTACDMALQDRSTMIHCIPGEESGHARALAANITNRGLLNPHTKRPVKAEALGDFQSPTQNRKVKERFDSGETDVVTLVRLGSETYHRKGGIGALILAWPSGAKVDMGQMIGRGAGLNEKDQLTYIFTILDLLRSHYAKKIWTAYDEYGLDQIHQGLEIVSRFQPQRPASIRTAQYPRPRTKLNKKPEPTLPELLDTLSEPVRDAANAIPDGQTVEDITLVRKTYPEAPSGYIPIGDLPAIQQGHYTRSGAQQLLAPYTTEKGEQFVIHVLRDTPRVHVLAAANSILEERYRDPATSVKRNVLSAFLHEQGWPLLGPEIFDTTCTEAGITVEKSKGHAKVIEGVANIRLFLEHLTETALVDANVEIPIHDIGTGLGRSSSVSFERIAKREFLEQIYQRRNGLPHHGYRLVAVLPLAYAAKVVRVASEGRRNNLLESRLAGRTPDKFIQEIAKQRLERMREFRLKVRIGQEAIDGFMEQFGSNTKSTTIDAWNVVIDETNMWRHDTQLEIPDDSVRLIELLYKLSAEDKTIQKVLNILQIEFTDLRTLMYTTNKSLKRNKLAGHIELDIKTEDSEGSDTIDLHIEETRDHGSAYRGDVGSTNDAAAEQQRRKRRNTRARH